MSSRTISILWMVVLGTLLVAPGRAIIYGLGYRPAHSNKCRHRVIETASTNKDVAARVNKAIDRDVEYHARKLEAEVDGKRKSADEGASEEKKVKEPRSGGTEPPMPVPFQENHSHTPSSSSSQAPSMAFKYKGEEQIRLEEERG